MAITSNFNSTTGVLTTTGDSHASTITTSRDAAGQIFVNDGAVSINGGPATVANTGEIEVFGGAGNDTISVDETNGRLPARVRSPRRTSILFRHWSASLA